MAANGTESKSLQDNTVTCRRADSESVEPTWSGAPAGGDLLRGSLVYGGNPSLCGAFQVTPRRRLAIPDTLRPSGEFVPETWYSEDKCGRLSVRLYLAPQPSDEHVDVAIIELGATPDNGMTQLVTRLHAARAAYECGQQRSLAPRQLYFTTVTIDKAAAGQVEFTVPDS